MAAAFLILFVWSAWTPTRAFGRPFLQFLAGAGFLGALLAGMTLTFDSLSREKREGTLDLLFLTDLSIRDVILGKLLSKSVVPIYGLLAMVPILEMSVFIGGTTASECGRLYLVWLNALFYAMACGFFVSALSREQRTALFGVLIAVLILAAGLPLGGLAISRATGNTMWIQLSLLASPTGPWSYVLANNWFWGTLITNIIVTCTFLALAYHLVLRSRKEAVYSVPAHRTASQEHRPLALRKNGEKSALLDARPIQWLMSRRARTPWLLWACCIIALGLLPFSHALDPTRLKDIASFLLGIHVLFKLTLATNVTHLFVADKRSGALESLLATSVDVREMATALRRSFQRRLGVPMLLLELVTLAMTFQLFEAGLSQVAFLLLAAAVLLPVDAYSVFWVGLFQGMAARTGAVALATTVFEILLVPWAWFAVSAQVFVRSPFSELLLLFAIVLPINHLWFVYNARTNLWRHFRTLALKPFGEKNPSLESDWSPINWEEEPTLQQ